MEPKVTQACHRNKERLLKYRNVVAVYVGKKRIGGHETTINCVKVGVREKIPADELWDGDIIPKTVRPKWYSTDAVLTDVEQVGTFVALQDRTARIRPVPAGVSVGHRDISAGTLGIWVLHEGQVMFLSNNHVLADTNKGNVGDPIVQPGPVDGGQVGVDEIGILYDFAPIAFEGSMLPPDECQTARTVVTMLNWCCKTIGSRTVYQAGDRAAPNYIDAALGVPSGPEVVSATVVGKAGQPPIAVSGIADLQLGDRVVKSGRTTGWQEGRVIGVQGTAQVQYGFAEVAIFEDQLFIDPPGFSLGGDSGSAILKDEGDGVYSLAGLLFAGSDEMTIANPIHRVLEKFPLGVL